MLIDSHVHIGTFYGITTSIMPCEMVMQSMEKYGIDYSLVSNASGCEFDSTLKPLGIERKKSQAEINYDAIAFAKSNPGRIGVLLWGKPFTETADEIFEKMIVENRGVVLGIKLHPFHSQLHFDDTRIDSYCQMARNYHLPILVHCANDRTCEPSVIAKMAEKYPDVIFIMAHLGLGTDHQEAISLISTYPNLYGDTAWVPWEDVKKAIDTCGSEKILFGTDNPINGLDTYDDEDIYNHYFKELRDTLSQDQWDNFTHKNFVSIFQPQEIL